MITYRKLEISEIDGKLYISFIRRQVVTKCWRKINGVWEIKYAPFIDDWSTEDYEALIIKLRNIIAESGFVFGAFINEKLKGFAAVQKNLIGSRKQYADLVELHVSYDVRRQGIGTKLFFAAADFARESGAKKLYISSHSAVESQSFYRSLGCIDALELNTQHVKSEPFDCQLEFKL
ncbi:MAG: GNAT family N-acetyltransferase [Clostridia bacterium]|nr:GNAT family N-acetyltransferase [Clostridia bacterium]